MALETITFGAALITGFTFGAGPCNISCLPYLGPVFLFQEGGIRQSWRVIAPFTLGRLLGYSLLGLAAGLAGGTVSNGLDASVAGWVLGIVTVILGVHLLRKPMRCHKQSKNTGEQPINLVRRDELHPAQPGCSTSPNPVPLFFMGASMTLNPCVPLTAILAAASATGSALNGASLGLAFGLGAVFLPMIVFGVLFAHLGQEIHRELGKLTRYGQTASAGMLIVLGLATLLGFTP
jgi:cytochrome c biogenesis protein CcdA